ncbi:Ger(x)C family spore germination protein [Paenibacillus sp. NPDC056579]|uniref:Ger(x)C family spore germination protein n=1 Tax=Paenibacillus sp. NPDC056579 TaxID=3345871 RepID=UPI003673D5BE
MKRPEWRRRLRVAGIAVVPVLVLLTGCWDRTELNDQAIIVGFGLDKPEDKEGIELSVQLIAPRQVGGQGMGKGSQQGGGGKSTLARIARGMTISDAMSKMQESLSRKLFWGHSEVMVIGEELAKEKRFSDYLDFMARYPKTRLNSNIFIKKGKASDLMQAVPAWELYSAEVVRELAKVRTGLEVSIKDVLEGLSGDSKAAAIPWIEENPWLDNGQKGQIGLRMNGAAIIKNGRMVKYVDDKLTRGILWLRNEIQHPTITITPEEAEGFVSMLQLQAKTELIPEIKGDHWKMTVKIETEDDILENSTNLQLGNVQFKKLLEEETAKDIKNRIEMTLNKIQKEAKADVIGFDEAFHRKYPKIWEKSKERWNEIFPRVEVEIDVKAKIRRPGLSTAPQGKPKEEIKEK